MYKLPMIQWENVEGDSHFGRLAPGVRVNVLANQNGGNDNANLNWCYPPRQRIGALGSLLRIFSINVSQPLVFVTLQTYQPSESSCLFLQLQRSKKVATLSLCSS